MFAAAAALRVTRSFSCQADTALWLSSKEKETFPIRSSISHHVSNGIQRIYVFHFILSYGFAECGQRPNKSHTCMHAQPCTDIPTNALATVKLSHKKCQLNLSKHSDNFQSQHYQYYQYYYNCRYYFVIVLTLVSYANHSNCQLVRHISHLLCLPVYKNDQNNYNRH